MASPRNFEITPVAAPVEYNKFAFRDLYMRRTFKGPSANQAVIVNPSGGFGASNVHNWPIYDGLGSDAQLVARGQGMHINAGRCWYNTFCIVFEIGRLKGSTLQAMGVTLTFDDDYSIVGGTGEFAMASGVVNRVIHKQGADTDIDKLTITGLIPVLKDSQTTGISGSSTQSPVTKIGPWGGIEGLDADVREPPHHLESVTIRSGAVIDSLTYSYVDQVGRKHTAGRWGGSGGNTTMIQLAPSEFIKEVSGTTGVFGPHNVVTSIKFVTNFQIYGPFGEAHGTPFSVPVQGDNGIVGFFGRAGLYVHALGFYVRA